VRSQIILTQISVSHTHTNSLPYLTLHTLITSQYHFFIYTYLDLMNLIRRILFRKDIVPTIPGIHATVLSLGFN
jgi:hypothetical protein